MPRASGARAGTHTGNALSLPPPWIPDRRPAFAGHTSGKRWTNKKAAEGEHPPRPSLAAEIVESCGSGDDLSGLGERGHRHRGEHGASGDQGAKLGHWGGLSDWVGRGAIRRRSARLEPRWRRPSGRTRRRRRSGRKTWSLVLLLSPKRHRFGNEKVLASTAGRCDAGHSGAIGQYIGQSTEATLRRTQKVRASTWTR